MLRNSTLFAEISCRLFVALGCPLLILSCQLAGPTGDAADLVRNALHPTGCDTFLGDLVVKEGENLAFNAGWISWGLFKEVQKWEEAGLVTIAAEDVLSSDKSFSWKDWFARTQRGHVKKIRIEATPKGHELAEVNESGEFLEGQCYREVLEKVVSDQETEVRTERYRVIQSRTRREPTELGELLATVGVTNDRWIRGEFKVRLLLNWDAFDKKWLYKDSTGRIVGGMDTAVLAEEFQTDYGLPPS